MNHSPSKVSAICTVKPMKWALYGIFEQLWRMTTQIIGSVGVKAHAMCPTTLLFFMGGGTSKSDF